MRKPLLTLLCASFGAAFSIAAAAHGGGGGGGFGGGFSHGTAVGPSSSSTSLENSNGRFSQDRDQGANRAEDRMSEESLEHDKAASAHQKVRHHARRHRSEGSDQPETR